MEPGKKSAIRFLILALGLLAPFAASWLFLVRAGEYLDADKVVVRQQERGSIVGNSIPGLSAYVYKLGLVRARKPEVLALGSSRVLQFREEAFLGTFVNAGKAGDNLVEMDRFLKAIPAQDMPGLVILGLDPWMFLVTAQRGEPDLGDRGLLRFQEFTALYRHLFEGKITLRDATEVLFLGRNTCPLLDTDMIGLQAIVDCSGYRPDGSRLLGEILLGGKPELDELVRQSGDHAKRGLDPLKQSLALDPSRFDLLQDILACLGERGVRVVLFSAPYAPATWGVMREMPDEFAYVDEVFRVLAERGVQVHVFTDPASLDAPQCEFEDEVHGGDVVYLRILARFLESEPDLAGFIDAETVRKGIAANQGRAIAVFGPGSVPPEGLRLTLPGCPD